MSAQLQDARTAADRSDNDPVARTHRLLVRAAHAQPDERRRLEDEAILLNTGLAESVARRYTGRSEEYADLLQVAYLGLVNAVRRFSPERGVDFISFAMPTISGEIKRFFRDQGWTIRPPRRLQELHRRVVSTSAHLAQLHGHTPAPSEIAEHLGESSTDVEEAIACRSCYTPASIDMPTRNGDGTFLSDLLGEADANFSRSEAVTALKPLCRQLPERDQRVLFLRYFRGWTQQEIARELGVTQMQISRMLTRILTRLRSELEGTSPVPQPRQAAAAPTTRGRGRVPSQRAAA